MQQTEPMTLTSQQINNFRDKIYSFYRDNRRSFIWREDICPYKVFISEVMLQQTQTARVTIKFEQWLQKFSSFQDVAGASSHEILTAWQGLGYNRRGLALQKASQMIVYNFQGILPSDPKLLQQLPGIGPNTAGSICAFAFNLPVVFIETNIRSVYLHEFFQGQDDVDDKSILSLVAQTIDVQDARNWYYALMDYGVFLKKTLKVKNTSSKHYARQSKFIGSKREIRGLVVRLLTKLLRLHHDDLIALVHQQLPHNYHDVTMVLQTLVQEKLIFYDSDSYFL